MFARSWYIAEKLDNYFVHSDLQLKQDYIWTIFCNICEMDKENSWDKELLQIYLLYCLQWDFFKLQLYSRPAVQLHFHPCPSWWICYFDSLGCLAAWLLADSRAALIKSQFFTEPFQCTTEQTETSVVGAVQIGAGASLAGQRLTHSLCGLGLLHAHRLVSKLATRLWFNAAIWVVLSCSESTRWKVLPGNLSDMRMNVNESAKPCSRQTLNRIQLKLSKNAATRLHCE